MVALDAATLLSQNHLKLLSDLSEIPYSRVRNDSMRFSTFGELLALCHGKRISIIMYYMSQSIYPIGIFAWRAGLSSERISQTMLWCCLLK